jgi:hypothetical protein
VGESVIRFLPLSLKVTPLFLRPLHTFPPPLLSSSLLQAESLAPIADGRSARNSFPGAKKSPFKASRLRVNRTMLRSKVVPILANQCPGRCWKTTLRPRNIHTEVQTSFGDVHATEIPEDAEPSSQAGAGLPLLMAASWIIVKRSPLRQTYSDWNWRSRPFSRAPHLRRAGSSC